MNIQQIYELVIKNGLSTDSRKAEAGHVFFALKGENFDGNQYAANALAESKCSYAIVDEPEYAVDEQYITVDNVLETLQTIANIHRRKLGVKLIAITGSNGKTTTKELTAKILAKKYQVYATKGNLNNHIGVPLTLLSIPADIDFNQTIAVVEMGANHKGEIATLCQIAEPDFGMITNIGKAHIEGFGSVEGVKATKGELYQHIRKHNGLLFVNADDEMLCRMSENHKRYTYSIKNEADCRFEYEGCSPFLYFIWHYQQKEHTISSRLIGKYNLENAAAAITIGQYFGVPASDIINAVETYEPKNNRSQLLETRKNTVLLDAYNANPTSMTVALRNFGELNGAAKSVILGDMLELGENSIDEHREIIRLLSTMKLEQILLVGEQFLNAAQKENLLSAKLFINVSDCNSWLSDNPIRNSHILIKGSRRMELEKTVARL